MSPRVKKETEAKPKKRPSKGPKVKEEESVAAPRAVQTPRPKGAAPLAMVSSRHEGAMIERRARGFSMGELGGAGFNLREASRLGLTTDIRRRTVLEPNVESLKSWFTPTEAPAPKPAKAEPAPKPRKRAPSKKTKKQA